MSPQRIFEPLGPAPIYEAFPARLNRAQPWGTGRATGAIEALELTQDPNTNDGTLFAGSVNGGIWQRAYNGAGDDWGAWKQVSSFAEYRGVQSISDLKVTEDRNWLIAAAGIKSSFIGLGGDIQDPLQFAFLNANGSVGGWFTNEPGIQDAIKGKSVNALEESENVVIVGTDDGLYIGKIDGGLKSMEKVDANNQLIEASGGNIANPNGYQVLSIAKGASGRIYASANHIKVNQHGQTEAFIGCILTTTISELKQNPANAWKIVDGSIERCANKSSLKLSTSTDPASGKDILYLGTAGLYPEEAYDYIYRLIYDETADAQEWSSKYVYPLIGSSQASLHASFAADPNDPNSVFAGGNFPQTPESVALSKEIGQLIPPYGAWTGGLTSITFNGNDATLTEHFASSSRPTNAGGTATHADSRDIAFLRTKTGVRIIEASDGGIGIKGIEPEAPWLFYLNDGLRTTESFASDWSNIGNLSITAMQDNALAIGKHNQSWINVTSGDGTIARFDDAKKDNYQGYAHAYYGSQAYSSNGILETAAYDQSGTLRHKDRLWLEVLNRYGNFEEFINYDMIPTGYNTKFQAGYKFYLPFETNNYRAGDIVLAGQRNLYEQIIPHWALPTAGEMQLVPLLKNEPLVKEDGKYSTRHFTALEIGSEKVLDYSKSKPYSWDALYTSFRERDKKGKWVTHLYGREAGEAAQESNSYTDIAEDFSLRKLTGYLPKEAQGNVITGLSFNPNNSNQLWASIAKESVAYTAPPEGVNKSYLIYSGNGGKSWKTITESGLNGIPSNAQLQQVQYVPAKDGNPAELYLSGYGGVWHTTIDRNEMLGRFSSAKWDGLEQGNGWNSPPSGTGDPNFGLWTTDLEYDPVDDVVVASTMGQGVWLLKRSELEAAPNVNPGTRISPIVLPQDNTFLKRKRVRDINGVMTVSLVRTNENIDKHVSVDLKLEDGWEKHISIATPNEPEFNILNGGNSATINFAPGVNELSFLVATTLRGYTFPDINLAIRLENPVNTVITEDSPAYVYLYANGEAITMNQEASGVFYSDKTPAELEFGVAANAQQVAALMPRSNLNKGDQLFWFPVNSDGSVAKPKAKGNAHPDQLWLLPSSPNYIKAVRRLIDDSSHYIATSNQSFQAKAFSPEKAALAFRNPEAVLDSEGISIGDLVASSSLQNADRFALALKDKKGNIRVSTQGFSVDQHSLLDNTLTIGAPGRGSQVVLAPADGELFVTDDSYFISTNTSPSEKIDYNLDIARFSQTKSGYGIFRVDNPLGQLYNLDTGTVLDPGDLAYAKEAFKRSVSNGLDGITGLPIPEYAQTAQQTISLATGNYYGMYITPGKVHVSEDSILDLSQILFSIRKANQINELKHVSMGTGYFAFEDGGAGGDRDFNDMLFSITPKIASLSA